MSDIPLIIAVDYDRTLAKAPGSPDCNPRAPWPHAGEPIPAMVQFVRQLSADGHQLILDTCRSGDALETAVNATHDWGLTWDAINENLPGRIALYGADTRKISADVRLDDTAFRPFTLAPDALQKPLAKLHLVCHGLGEVGKKERQCL